MKSEGQPGISGWPLYIWIEHRIITIAPDYKAVSFLTMRLVGCNQVFVTMMCNSIRKNRDENVYNESVICFTINSKEGK